MPGAILAGTGIGSILWADHCRRNGPYMIFGMPRSRTTWFSAFMNLGLRTCHHELELKFESLSGFLDGIEGKGNSSTLAWRVLPKILDRYPLMRFVWLHRDAENVSESTRQVGFPWFTDEYAENLISEAESAGAKKQLVVDVEELTIEVLEEVWTHLAPHEKFPAEKAECFLRMNIQLSEPEFQRVTTNQIPKFMEAFA